MLIMRCFLLLLLFCSTMLSASPATFEQQLHEHVKFNPAGPNSIGYITIEGHSEPISDATWLYVKKALEHYSKTKPIFIILNLNSPGGEVFASQKISDALKDFDTQEDIPVIAFINNWAISAGAMLAYSCRFIVITKDASMGAAEPIIMGETGETKTASEKINSALRSDFANRARFFNRNPNIAEKMVDKDLILVIRNNEIIKLDSESQIQSTGSNPDVVISPKGKLLTLTAEEMIKYGVADQMLQPAKLSPLTDAEKSSGQWPAEKLLLSQQPFFAKIPHATVDVYQMDWKTAFFVFLANPVVSSVLVLGLMFGFYMEMNHPGFGLPGIVALLSLFLIVISHLSLEIANWLEVIFLITGLLIIVVDLFVLPTFGILGIIGVLFFLGGLFGMLLPSIHSVDFDFSTQTLNAAGAAFLGRLVLLCATLVIGCIGIFLLSRYVTPKAAAWSRLILTGNEQEGYISGQNPSTLPPPGSKGIVYATLRPAGKVLIDNTIYEAITMGNFIEKDTPIVVRYIEGSMIVVDVDTGTI